MFTFAKTVCKPGAFLTVVPVGLLTTLQYNSNGILEKITLGYDSTDTKNITDKLIGPIKESKIAPLTIPTKGGTTWITGVFHTERQFFNEGNLPNCLYESILSDIQNNAKDYNFYAGAVESLASSFKSVMTTRNWLSMSKFNVLPGFLIPADLNNDGFEKMVNTERYPFKYPLISGYIIHQSGEFKYCPLNLIQSVVTRVTKYLASDGSVRATLASDLKFSDVNYSDVIRYNIHPNTAIIEKADSKIIYSSPVDNKKRDKRSDKLTCTVCGKTYIASKSGQVICDDIHCRSRLYPHICHFLKVLNLPEMEFNRFKQLIKDNEILCLTDILILPEYRELEIVRPLAKLIESVVPVDVCADSSVFTVLASRCSNSAKTLKYYIDNPIRIASDLDINSLFMHRLIEWLNDGYNVTTLETLLEADNITVETQSKKFDGPPIFRDKTIAITGNFKHGDMNEIISILQSYGAKVVTQYDSSVGCLIVGDLKEHIDGKIIKQVKSAGVPIFDESQFFSTYDIDSDLTSNNLL